MSFEPPKTQPTPENCGLPTCPVCGPGQAVEVAETPRKLTRADVVRVADRLAAKAAEPIAHQENEQRDSHSPLVPGRQYHEHTSAALVAEHQYRGIALPDPGPVVNHVDAAARHRMLVQSLQADDERRGVRGDDAEKPERIRILFEPNGVDEMLLLLRSHIERHPDHGINCVCMDGLARGLRNALQIPPVPPASPDFSAWLAGPENQYRRRLHHILSMVARGL